MTGARGALTVVAAGMASQLWEQDLGKALNTATTGSVYMCLQLIFPNPIFHPEGWIVGTPSFSVKIFGPCSGVEGMALILVFLRPYLVVLPAVTASRELSGCYRWV